MDSSTKQKLETVQQLTPRYLFRVWCNEEKDGKRVSGGYVGLNTTKRITPLAFFKGRGSASAYHLSREEFTDMAKGHLTGERSPETEFSSWAAALRWPLWKIRPRLAEESVYISIIDTYKLGSGVQIFFVPELDFLKPGEMNYYHEYLAHGIIEGSGYKAMPLTTFLKAGVQVDSLPALDLDAGLEHSGLQAITTKDIEIAKSVGKKYGKRFELAMTLAIVCLRLRDTSLFRNGVLQLESMAEGLFGIEIPKGWDQDPNILTDAVFESSYGEIEQMVRLKRALIERERKIAERWKFRYPTFPGSVRRQ